MCPIAVITVQEGAQVIPQTLLHLVGDQSSSPLGEVTKWVWKVEQPEGSVATFSPSANFSNPTFLANVAGSYLFSLEVEDAWGTPGCEPAFAEVIVIPDEAVHVELLWNTPGDPDPADSGPEAGADLDLHFLHPYATPGQPNGTGSLGWFNTPFDCYWFNPAPNWGSVNPDILDNPQLDLDDTDGAGPENLNLALPENGMTYSIGAHYWADHGFGSSFATIRVYLFGTLVFEKAAVELENNDLWEACTLDWPEATVTPIGNGSQILPDYKDPFRVN